MRKGPLMLLMTLLLMINVAIALAEPNHLKTFVAGVVAGLWIADLIVVLHRRKDERE